MFYSACTCQGTVADSFTRECQIIPRFREHAFGWLVKNNKNNNNKKKRMKGRKCEFTCDANLQVSTEAGTSNNMKHSSTDTVLSVP